MMFHTHTQTIESATGSKIPHRRQGGRNRFFGLAWIRRAVCGGVAILTAALSQPIFAQDDDSRPKPTQVTPAKVQTASQSAETAVANQAAAEKVLSILMAIDPYLPAQQSKGKLLVFGTPTMGALAHQWGVGFQRFHPDAVIEISEMKGQPTLAHLASHPHGVAMISRPLSENEFEKLRESGLKNPMQVEIGMQGLGVFVHADNPISGINQAQFLRIFAHHDEQDTSPPTVPPTLTPTLTKLTWGELGLTGDWKDKAVHLICRETSSGTHSFLKNELLVDRSLRQPKDVYNSSAEVLQAIAEDPLAIGLNNLRSSSANVKGLSLYDGTTALDCCDFSILTGQYPLVRRITLLFDAGSEAGSQLAREYIRYALCQDGQRETILSGFFPLDPPLLRAQLMRIESSK